jgi:hypothetical protein
MYTFCNSSDCSQEVWNEGLVRYSSGGLVSQRVEDIKSFVQLVANVEDGGHVTTSIAVVRGRPDCHQVLVSEPVFEAVHHELMGSGNETDVVDVIKF